jgi:hypothetical protein
VWSNRVTCTSCQPAPCGPCVATPSAAPLALPQKMPPTSPPTTLPPIPPE